MKPAGSSATGLTTFDLELSPERGAMQANVSWKRRRVEQFLKAVASGCDRTGQHIVRLTHADELMARQTEGKGKASKLPQLKELLLRRPLASARSPVRHLPSQTAWTGAA
jgi:hypothetical protein